MTNWIIRKYGRGAVPYFFMTAMIALALAGIAGTVFFAMAEIMFALFISIPTMVVGVIGIPVTGMALSDKRYI